MPTLGDVLPDLAEELAAALRTSGRDDLAAQLGEVEVDRWTHDTSCNAAYIYLTDRALDSGRDTDMLDQAVNLTSS